MLLPAKRDRLSMARQALDGDVPNVAATAGPTPVGAIGGDQVLDVSRNIAETGQAAPTVVPDNYGEVTGTGIESTGDPGAVGGDGTPSENPAMMPDEPVEGETPEDFDEAAAQFNWSLLDDALQGVDTTEEEAQMQAQQDRMMGQALMDQRAAAGASGFGESGAMMAMEGDLRSDAARQLGLDVSGLRREEAQRAIENAMKAQGIDIEKMKAADQARLNELIASFMMNEGELPPEPEPEGGGSLAEDINKGITDIGEGLSNVLRGTDEQQAQENALHTPGVPEGANVVEYPEDSRENREAQLEAEGYQWETVTDDGVTVYYSPEEGQRIYVRWS